MTAQAGAFFSAPPSAPRTSTKPGTWQASWGHLLNEWMKSLKYLLGFRTCRASPTWQDPYAHSGFHSPLWSPPSSPSTGYLHALLMMSPPWNASPRPVPLSGLAVASPLLSVFLHLCLRLCSPNKFCHGFTPFNHSPLYSQGYLCASAIWLSSSKLEI